MPKVLIEVKQKKRYPWIEWFSRGKVRLWKGRDFNGRLDTFLQQVRQRGSRWGYSISIQVAEDEKSILVRMTPK